MQDGRGSADSHQTKYRPDLDGLRAIAVLSVIAYHLSINLLPGGYLGVDIFFVLSGYLITKIIWREALAKQFSVARFYERRVRRILPALGVLLIVVSAFSIWILLPIDLEGLAKSAFATLVFAANIYFWSDAGYFTQAAEEKPLLHVWSLGVEEQFYILFPLLVILCIRWRRSALLPLTSALVLLSLMSNILLNKMALQSVAFYLLPARAWEIGAGALLALAPPSKIETPWLRQALAIVAGALILASLCLHGGGVVFGGVAPSAIFVVLGTTLAIHLGNEGGNLLTAGLAKAPLAWIGLISYSLYLWHWPILVFARYYLLRPSLSPAEAAGAVALMFALATLSWRYVERPFRDRTMPIRTVLVWAACGCLVVAIASAAVLRSKGFPSRFTGEVARINLAVGTEYRCTLKDYVPFGPSHGCLMFLPSRNPADATVALFGNSHAQMYAPLVASIVQQNNERGILVPLNACLPLPDLNLGPACMDLAAKDLSAVEALPRVGVVIISMTWEWKWSPASLSTRAGPVPAEMQTKLLIESVDRLISHLERLGKTVVLVGPISAPGWDFPSIVGRELAFHNRISEPLFFPESTFMLSMGTVIEHYSSRQDIIFIRPDLVQCEQGRCDYLRDGASLFADSNHITASALPLFRPVFESALTQAFTRAAQSKPQPSSK
jgi:peptidoglycan/LPS O-acetylase OafA/YrhL